MNWIKFALWLSAIYFSYYGTLILWDILRGKKQPYDEKSHTLSFEEDIEPIRETAEEENRNFNSSVLSSGGVTLKQLFNLAREEAIEYTRPVSY
ncbi:hypothetical protein IDJ75_11320 [Mucilaginibacter rigui]|uniref:Uncharacterized protein n=1 Tax=Mucilaginibacter rigui TaxID=534635 RepID=A0ABR7X5N8_9SPHI|nr:hypothetical protein [Mucilaginibacter rigui]MBD1385871.1 hypothetical protein [Mucilaginibacter rigui]